MSQRDSHGDPVIAVIIRELKAANERLVKRLESITNEEWFWEPFPGCWSVRPRGESSTEWANGSGGWVIDYGPPADPAPFSTVAWRVAHTASTTAGYLDMIAGWDWDTGTPWDQYPAPETAATGLAFYNQQADRLLGFCSSLAPAGLGRLIAIPWQGPTPIGEILEVLASEAFHHGAEVGLLRDIYRWTGGRQLAAD